jgi:hypothetical protein
MPFCPNCRFEYRPEIWECPDCKVRLVDKLPDEEIPKRKEDDTTQNVNYVPLRSLPSRLYAQMLKEALENESIPSLIKGDEAVFRATTNHLPVSKVMIWVREEDQEKAQAIADQMFDHI